MILHANYTANGGFDGHARAGEGGATIYSVDLTTIRGGYSAMKRIVLAVLSAFALGALAGCNTMEGLGKDIQKGGEAIEKAAEKNKY
jgi:predicted small secreted protein